MAVPGNVLSGRSRGSHRLIRDGARIVETADDVLEEIGLSPTGAAEATAVEEDPVLARMEPGDPYDVDALVQQSGLAPRVLLSRLTELELRGSVARIGPGRFVRLPAPVVT